MKALYRYLLYATVIFSNSSCLNLSEIDKILITAGTNRSELQKVIDHYQHNDSLKLKAAYFLIGNMVGHTSLWNTDIARFRQSVNRSGQTHQFSQPSVGQNDDSRCQLSFLSKIADFS